MKNFVSIAGFILFFNLAFLNQANSQGPLLRFPDIHEDLIVFVHGEDIWSVSTEGGVATRLTIHDGEERYPRFSPDGNLIAFTGYYDGNPDVYVMNKFGGNITRVTYHPGFEEVIGWHPDKNKIIFSAYRSDYPGYSELFLISPDGTGLEKLILHEAARGSFSADGNKIAYNKVSRENRTWKRYKGGTAQDIYIYDLKTDEETNISNFEGTDRMPMWINDKVYFTSDRDRVLNIYSADPVSGQIEQITTHKNYDIRRPEFGGNKIVYELGGDLMVLDINTKRSAKVEIEILTDMPEARPYLKNVKDNITGIDCSPGGERAVIVARGEIFTVPFKEGSTRNLTRSSGARDKDAVWSPDGKNIAYISDESGEYNVYIVDQLGESDPKQLTNFDDGYRHSLRWSPDSKMLTFTDHTLTLNILDVESKKLTSVDKAEYENIDVSLDVKPIYDFNWSPDSRYIAYSKMDEDQVNKVYIYSISDNSIHAVSTIFNDFHPVFSKDGNYLFFISNRRFNPTFCDFEWEMVYKKTSGIYCMTLQKNGEPFIKLKSDEVEIADDSETDKEESEELTVNIDWEGLSERVEALPVKRGNYRYLATNENALYFLNKDEGDFNRFEYRVPSSMDLYSFSFDEQEEAKVIEGINSYKLSSDGTQIVYKKGKDIGIIKSSATDSKGNNLKLTDLKMW
ncbi:MAG: peptidase S41, partial [Bacteroidetes bacterium]